MCADAEHHARENAGNKCTQNDSRGTADKDRFHRLAEHMPQDSRLVGTERHADSDLAHGSAHAVGHHTVNADGTQQQRQSAQGAGEPSDDARGCTPDIEIIFKTRGVHRDIRVDGVRHDTHAFCDIAEAASIAHQNIAARVIFGAEGIIKIVRIRFSEMRDLGVGGDPDHGSDVARVQERILAPSE